MDKRVTVQVVLPFFRMYFGLAARLHLRLDKLGASGPPALVNWMVRDMVISSLEFRVPLGTMKV